MNIKSFLLNKGFFFACESAVTQLMALAEDTEAKLLPATASKGLSYEIQNGIAIIGIDGAMVKAHTSMSADCGVQAISYYDITKAIKQAENDPAVNTIVFKVDTVGGDVADAGATSDIIRNLTKPAYTYYNNIGASAGVLIFSAAKDGLYASESTQIGSIGVVSIMEKDDGNNKKTIEIVSSDAPNKRCSDPDSCIAQRLQMVNEYQEFFFKTLERNVNFSREQIIAGFNAGGMIFADKALEIGFLKGVMPFDEFLSTISASMPANSKNSRTFKSGAIMDEETRVAGLEALLAAKREEVIALQGENEKLKAKLEETTNIAMLVAKMEISDVDTVKTMMSQGFAEAALTAVGKRTIASGAVAKGDIETGDNKAEALKAEEAAIMEQLREKNKKEGRL